MIILLISLIVLVVYLRNHRDGVPFVWFILLIYLNERSDVTTIKVICAKNTEILSGCGPS